MLKVIYVLVLMYTPSGDLAKLAEYRDEGSCKAARDMAMEHALYQAVCVPITMDGRLPDGAPGR